MPLSRTEVLGTLHQLYGKRPDLFTQEDVSVLSQMDSRFKPQFEYQAPEVGKMMEQFFSGMVSGFTGLGDFAPDPTDSYEGIANSLGSMLGFVGVIVPSGTLAKVGGVGLQGLGFVARAAKAEKVAAGLGRLTGTIGTAKSVPLLVGDVGFRAIERTGLMSSAFLKGRPILTQAVEGGIRLGIASGFGQLHEVYDEGFMAPVKAALLGAATAGMFDAGVGNIPFLKQQIIPYQMIKGLAGATVNVGMTSALTGEMPFTEDNLASSVYEALVGGYFGFHAADALTYKASKWIMMAEKQPGMNLTRLRSFESTDLGIELQRSDPELFQRVKSMVAGSFLTKRTTNAIMRTLLLNVYGVDAFKNDVFVGDVHNIKEGQRVRREGGTVNDIYRVESVTPDGETATLVDPATGAKREEPTVQLTPVETKTTEAILPEAASDNRPIDFEMGVASTENAIGRFFSSIRLDAKTGKAYNEKIPADELVGHIANMQEKLQDILHYAQREPNVDRWGEFKSYMQEVAKIFRTTADGKVHPLTDKDFEGIYRWYTFEKIQTPAEYQTWSPYSKKLIPHYLHPRNNEVLVNTSGNIVPAKRIRMAFEDIPTGRLNEDGSKELVRGGSIREISTKEGAVDLYDAKLPDMDYGGILIRLYEQGKAYVAGSSDKHEMIYASIVSPEALGVAKREVDAQIARDPEFAAEYARLKEANVRRLQIPEKVWEDTYLNNVYLWMQQNGGKSLDVLLNKDTKAAGGAEKGYIHNVLDFNKRMQIMVQKYHPIDREIYASRLGGKAPLQFVYVNDVTNMAEKLKDLRPPGLSDKEWESMVNLNDGGTIVPGKHFNAIIDAAGITFEAGTRRISSIKPFYRDSDPVDGLALSKEAIHQANALLSKALGDYGLRPLSAAKQVGERQVYDYDVKNGKVVFSQGGVEKTPIAYEMNPEGLFVDLGTRDHYTQEINQGRKLAKQLFNQQNEPAVVEALVSHLLEQSYGTEIGNTALDKYKSEPSPANRENLLKQIENVDRMKLLEVVTRDFKLQKELNKYLLTYDAQARAQEMFEEGEYSKSFLTNYSAEKLLNAGLGDFGVALSKIAGSKMHDAYVRFFIQDVLLPRVPHSASAVLNPWTIDMLRDPALKEVWQGDKYFVAARDWEKQTLKGIDGKETTLGALWDAFRAFAGGSKGEIRPFTDFKGEEQLTYKKYQSALTSIVARVPIDSRSGAPALEFRGFVDTPGGGIFVSKKLMDRLGGADHDIDKAFVYFSMPEAVKRFYKRAAPEYEAMLKGSAEREDLYRGKTDPDLKTKSKAAMFDPLSRLLINKTVAGGRGEVLPFGVSVSERIGAFWDAVDLKLQGRFGKFRPGEKPPEGGLVGLQRNEMDRNPRTFIGRDPETGKKQYRFRAFGKNDRDKSAVFVNLRAADDIQRMQHKHTVINEAADAGKHDRGLRSLDDISLFLNLAATERVSITEGGQETILYDVKTHPFDKMNEQDRLVLRSFFGGKLEVVDAEGKVKPEAKVVWSEDKGQTYLIDGDFRMDRIRLKGSSEPGVSFADPRTQKFLGLATRYNLNSTDFGAYPKAVDKIFRRDRAMGEKWGINDVADTLEEFSANPLWQGTAFARMGERVQKARFAEGFLGRLGVKARFDSGFLKNFNPWNAFIAKYPAVMKLIGADKFSVGGGPGNTLSRRVELFLNMFGTAGSDRDIFFSARKKFASEGGKDVEVKSGKYDLTMVDLYIKRLVDEKILTPKEATDEYGQPEVRRQGALSDETSTFSDQMRFIKRERARLEDLISSRVAELASMTRFIEISQDFHLDQAANERLPAILQPIIDHVEQMKLFHDKAATLAMRRDPDIGERYKNEYDQMMGHYDMIQREIKSIVEKEQLPEEKLWEFADTLLLSTLKHRQQSEQDGRVFWKTHESSFGFRLAAPENVRKWAEALNESFDKAFSLPGPRAVRELWERRIGNAEAVGAYTQLKDLPIFQKVFLPKAEVEEKLTKEHLKLINKMTEAVAALPSLKDSPDIFVKGIRKIYGVADLGDMTLPQIKGLYALLTDMRQGSTFMQMLWSRFKKPELYEKLGWKHFMQFMWTIDMPKRAYEMMFFEDKLFNAKGELSATENIRPFDFVDAAGQLKKVYASAGDFVSNAGQLQRIHNTANRVIQKLQEDTDKETNERFDVLSQGVLSITRKDAEGKPVDNRYELAEMAIYQREIEGMMGEYNAGTISPAEKELLAELQVMRQERRNAYKNILEDKYRLRGKSESFTGDQMVEMYKEKLNYIDEFGDRALYGTQDQWNSLVVRNPNGTINIVKTQERLDEHMLDPQKKMDIPLEILNLTDYFSDITQVAMATELPRFSMTDRANFSTPALKGLAEAARKAGIVDGLSLDAAHKWMEKVLAGGVEHDPITGEAISTYTSDEVDLAKSLKRYFRVKLHEDSYQGKVTGKDEYSQAAVDKAFAEGDISKSDYLRQTLMWQNPRSSMGRIFGYWPHMEWDKKATETYIRRKMDEVGTKASNPAEAKRLRDSLSNLQLKLNGEGYYDDGGMLYAEGMQFLKKELNTLGYDTTALTSSIFRSRTANVPTYSRDLSVLDQYTRKVNTARVRKYASMQSKKIIRNFEYEFYPKEASGQVPKGYTEGWSNFYRMYVRNAMNHPSIFADALLNSPEYNMKRSPYYWLSDHFFIVDKTMSRKFYNIFSKANKLMPNEMYALKLNLGHEPSAAEIAAAEKKKFDTFNDFSTDPKTGDFTPQARINIQRGVSMLRNFSSLEGKYETAALLFHSKTALANIFSGEANNMVRNGFRTYMDSLRLDTWKDIAIKERDGIEFTSMHDVYKWWESTGAVQNQLMQEGSQIRDFNTPSRKRFLAEAIDMYRRKPDASDESLYSLAKKHGLDRKFVDISAYFMKTSERYLRIHAGLAGYLKAREQYEELNLPLNTPFLIDMGIKTTQVTQFMYDAPNRPMFSATNIGRVWTRFKVWSWASMNFQRDTINAVKYMGFSPFTPEYARAQRLLTANLFSLGLATMLPYSIFGTQLPAPANYMQDVAMYFFGDDKQKDDLFFGSKSLLFKYPLSPLNEIMPPLARIPYGASEIFSNLLDGEVMPLASYTSWSLFPFGRMSRDVVRSFENPAMAFDFLTGLPMHQTQYKVNRQGR